MPPLEAYSLSLPIFFSPSDVPILPVVSSCRSRRIGFISDLQTPVSSPRIERRRRRETLSGRLSPPRVYRTTLITLRCDEGAAYLLTYSLRGAGAFPSLSPPSYFGASSCPTDPLQLPLGVPLCRSPPLPLLSLTESATASSPVAPRTTLLLAGAARSSSLPTISSSLFLWSSRPRVLLAPLLSCSRSLFLTAQSPTHVRLTHSLLFLVLQDSTFTLSYLSLSHQHLLASRCAPSSFPFFAAKYFSMFGTAGEAGGTNLGEAVTRVTFIFGCESISVFPLWIFVLVAPQPNYFAFHFIISVFLFI